MKKDYSFEASRRVWKSEGFIRNKDVSFRFTLIKSFAQPLIDILTNTRNSMEYKRPLTERDLKIKR